MGAAMPGVESTLGSFALRRGESGAKAFGGAATGGRSVGGGPTDFYMYEEVGALAVPESGI